MPAPVKYPPESRAKGAAGRAALDLLGPPLPHPGVRRTRPQDQTAPRRVPANCAGPHHRAQPRRSTLG